MPPNANPENSAFTAPNISPNCPRSDQSLTKRDTRIQQASQSPNIAKTRMNGVRFESTLSPKKVGFLLSIRIQYKHLSKIRFQPGMEALLEPEMECAAGWRLPRARPERV